jgi:hypothetical protein
MRCRNNARYSICLHTTKITGSATSTAGKGIAQFEFDQTAREPSHENCPQGREPAITAAPIPEAAMRASVRRR